MNRWAWALVLGLSACKGCNGCGGIDLPDTDDDPTDDDVTPEEVSPTPAPDTAPEPPCPWPESEPNNGPDEVDELPLEAEACGRFDTDFDADFFGFTLPEDAWLGLRVDAFSLGSFANVSVTLASDDAGISVGALGWQDTPDVRLLFPASAGDYQAIVRQAIGQGGGNGSGPDYFYEVIATSGKAPFSPDLTESDNEARGEPQRVLAGEGEVLLFGELASAVDEDWYEIVIPPGRHRLLLDVDAHEYGSAGNFALRLFDADGDQLAFASRGEIGWEPDPWLEFDSLVAQNVVVRVFEQGALHGAPIWYYLHGSLEAY